MTYEEKVNKSLIDANLDVDNFNNQDKLVYIAYYMGRESAVKELIDRQSKISLQRIFEAERIKYARMIYKFMKIQPSLINNYNQYFTKNFGSDLYSEEEDDE